MLAAAGPFLDLETVRWRPRGSDTYAMSHSSQFGSVHHSPLESTNHCRPPAALKSFRKAVDSFNAFNIHGQYVGLLPLTDRSHGNKIISFKFIYRTKCCVTCFNVDNNCQQAVNLHH